MSYISATFNHQAIVGTKQDRPTSPDGTTSDSGLSISFKATIPLKFSKITLQNIKNNYFGADDERLETTVECRLTYTSDGTSQTITIGTALLSDESNKTYNLSFSPSDTVYIDRDTNFSVSLIAKVGKFYYTIVDGDIKAQSEGSSGITNNYTKTPFFMLSYEVIEDALFYRDKNNIINEGYLYLDGLATDYYIEPTKDWLRDKNNIINEGYLYLDGLATDYYKINDWVVYVKTEYGLIPHILYIKNEIGSIVPVSYSIKNR